VHRLRSNDGEQFVTVLDTQLDLLDPRETVRRVVGEEVPHPAIRLAAHIEAAAGSPHIMTREPQMAMESATVPGLGLR
jgi:hypothetical protein